MTEQEFCQVVAQTLKGDHNDLRKEAIILRAHRAALATPSQPDPQSRGQAFDGEGEALKPLLPPAAVESGDYLEGWMDGQTYLILAHGGTAALSSAKRGEEG